MDHEIDAVRGLLTEGREEEALRLHRDLTGQGREESREALRSLAAGL
jgi:Arc/MetJ family transcription regulator